MNVKAKHGKQTGDWLCCFTLMVFTIGPYKENIYINMLLGRIKAGL